VSADPVRGASARSAPRFLIVRLGALGDIIHAIPAAAAVRAAFPESHIDWLVDPRYVSLLEMVTAVSHVVPLDPRAGVIRLLATLRGYLAPIARFSIQQTVDECTKDGWSMLPTRIVEEQPRARNRPVREDLDQPPLGQEVGHAILLKVISNAETVQRSLDGEVIVVESPDCRGRVQPVLAREARPFLPDARAGARFQSR